MHLTTWEIVLLFAFSFLFGALKSGFGVAGAVVTPALSLLIDPRAAVALLGPIALWTDIAALRNHWRKWDARQIWRMLPATVLGTLVGAWVLAGISNKALNRTLAAVTLGYGLIQWLQQRRATAAAQVAAQASAQTAAQAAAQVAVAAEGAVATGAASSRQSWLVSVPSALLFAFAGGVVSAISHAGGIIMTFYLLAVGLRKEVYIATLVSLFFAQNLLKVPIYAWVGVLSLPAFGLAVLTIPLVFAGGWVGKRISERLSHEQFDTVLNAIIVVIGLLLLFK